MATIRAGQLAVGDYVKYSDADGVFRQGVITRFNERENSIGGIDYAVTIEHSDTDGDWSSLVNWTEDTMVETPA